MRLFQCDICPLFQLIPDTVITTQLPTKMPVLVVHILLAVHERYRAIHFQVDPWRFPHMAYFITKFI